MLFSGVSIPSHGLKLETMQNKDHICTLVDAGFIIVVFVSGKKNDHHVVAGGICVVFLP